MSWELFVGLRYLRSRRSEAFVSVITGFEEDLRARILGLHPHLRVTSRLGTGIIDKPDDIVTVLKSDPRVEDAAAVVQSQMLASNGDTLLGVFARGIDAKSG